MNPFQATAVSRAKIQNPTIHIMTSTTRYRGTSNLFRRVKTAPIGLARQWSFAWARWSVFDKANVQLAIPSKRLSRPLVTVLTWQLWFFGRHKLRARIRGRLWSCLTDLKYHGRNFPCLWIRCSWARLQHSFLWRAWPCNSCPRAKAWFHCRLGEGRVTHGGLLFGPQSGRAIIHRSVCALFDWYEFRRPFGSKIGSVCEMHRWCVELVPHLCKSFPGISLISRERRWTCIH